MRGIPILKQIKDSQDSGQQQYLVDLTEIHLVINDIKSGIELCREHRLGGSMMKLIYCGIDALAFLSMPADIKPLQVQREQKKYFKLWVDKYLKFLHPRCTSEHLWEARNGLLHSHSAESIRVKQGKAPPVYYANRAFPAVQNAVDDAGERVIFISIETLKNELFNGIDQFIIDIFKDDKKSRIALERSAHMLKVVDCAGNPVRLEQSEIG